MKTFTPKIPWFPYVEMYIIRNKIWGHIKRSAPYFSGKLLDVGSGHMPYKSYIMECTGVQEYISMDLENSEIYGMIKPDIYWDGYKIPLPDASIDSVLITEVLEHCPEPALVLAEVQRVLKPEGKVIFSVPFIWYLHESPWDFYRYTPYAIQRLFKNAGISLPVLETYGDSDLAFLHFYFIWLKKGKLPKFIRFGIYLLTLPISLLCLVLANKKNTSNFKDGHIYIGTVGIGSK